MSIHKKALSLVLAISLVVGTFGGNAALAAEGGETVGGAHVGNASDLIAALSDESNQTIVLDSDITDLTSSVVVTHPVTIDGNGKRLSFTELDRAESTVDDGLILEADATVENLTVDAGLTSPETWTGTYAIHAYQTTATLEDVTATGGNGGILVNGSDVALDGMIDVSGNGFGGIEVSQGEDVTQTPKLTVSDGAKLVNDSEVHERPTVWEDGVTGTVEEEETPPLVQTEVTKDDKTAQTQYYLKIENSGKPYFAVGDFPDTVTTEKSIEEDSSGRISGFTSDGRTPVSVALNKGAADAKVRITVQVKQGDEETTDGIQLIAQDSAGNWYDIVKSGWGPPSGFQLADAKTDVYVVASQPGDYMVTINLVDVDHDDAVLATTEATATAAESAVLPAGENWQGPAGDPAKSLAASEEQSFVFPFKTTGTAKLSSLDLDVYLGSNTGDGRDYSAAVQLNLPADGSLSNSLTPEYLNNLLSQLAAAGKDEQKDNTITLLKAAGVEFDEAGAVTSVGDLSRHFAYNEDAGVGMWTITLDTTKLLDADTGAGKIEFLVQVTTDQSDVTWGNNNYVSYPDDTKAYDYAIAKPEETNKTIVSFEELDDSERNVKVESGTQAEDISFPATLKATDSEGNPLTLDVTWECKEGYSPDKAGHYSFTPVLPEGYTIQSMVKVPVVYVEVLPATVPVTGVSLHCDTYTHTGDLTAHQFTAYVTPSGATNQNVIWTSSNPAVATIDENGLMTMTGYGETTITVATEDGGLHDSCEVTVRQEPGEQEISDTKDEVASLPPASSITTAIDPESELAGQIEDAVSDVQLLGEDAQKIGGDNIGNLEALLETLTGVTPSVSVSQSDGIVDSGKVTALPTVSGLLLASGFTGGETAEDDSVSLTMGQIVPTAENAVLAFELNLNVDEDETHELAIPVTVIFQLPQNFVKKVGYTYSILHEKEDGGTEPLALNISGSQGNYTASFMTASFSTFSVVETYSGGSGSHPSGSNGSSSGSGTTVTPPVTAPSENTFASDTTADFTVNGAYQFKITSKNGAIPNFVVGTAGVFNTQLVKVSDGDYYFKLIAVGKPGDKAGVYVNGVKVLVATVGTTASLVKSDTTAPLGIKAGKSYLIRLTADSKPILIAGNSSAFRVDFVKLSGKDYFFRITATGRPGQAAGFYINSEKTPVTVATIA